MKVFMLLLELPSGTKKIATGDRDQIIISSEENIYLLENMGDKMIAEGLITGYQILTNHSAPVYGHM